MGIQASALSTLNMGIGWLGSTGTDAQRWSASPQLFAAGGSLRSTPATPIFSCDKALVERQRDGLAACGDGTVDGQAQLMRVVRVRDIAVRLSIGPDAVDQMVDLGVERMVVHVARIGQDRR